MKKLRELCGRWLAASGLAMTLAIMTVLGARSGAGPGAGATRRPQRQCLPSRQPCRRQRLRLPPPPSGSGLVVAAGPSAAAPTLSTPVGEPVIASASLPRDLSPWGMFLNADIVVKIVMVGLMFASLVTWTVWLAKNLELWKATRNGRAALAVLNEARSLVGGATRGSAAAARRWRGCCAPRSTRCRFRRIPTPKP